ncbi:aldo/keto reductase [Parendozoicomonas haliclonae]|uniref:Oxidoreductase YdhF n=1 Tax=Parendozoicomonas haliclonae TaxID=1960125 RepID=A0A1X7AIN3_9GAMM|nr:aldo/keto reductase [Parendozoicomonas haliclonae]SMA44054.1 Oxidoreductase YdhF [Parendozoicomonas haliclonae]
MNGPLSQTFPAISPIVYGCMGLGGGWDHAPVTRDHVLQAHAVVDAALNDSITLFDHADIYTLGKAEQVFGQVLQERPGLREQLILQSKCGIRFADGHGPKRYDFSREWILTSVENSLKRLQTDYLDILLLHRPDPLMEPDEVAAAFEVLRSRGMVRHFGVSNMDQHQIALLQASLDQPLVVNQMEMSLTKLDWLNNGVQVNTGQQEGNHFASGLLEYCRSNHVQLQAWGCLSQGVFTGRSLDGQPEAVQHTARLVSSMAEELSVAPEAIVLAWLMRHPAGIQPVIGTTSPERIQACAQATRVQLSREQWYQLYVTARGTELP